MKKYRYSIVRGIFYSEDCGEYISYGIRLTNGCFIRREIETIHDVSTDISVVRKLVVSFNKHKLSPIHFKDAVEDAII